MSSLIEGEPGFVLHVRSYKEQQSLIEAFSLHYGRIGMVMRPARKSDFRYQALLQPFTALKLSLRQGRSDLWQLQDCVQSGEAFSLPVPALFCGTYINELLYYLLQRHDPAPQLFAAYLSALRALSADDGSSELSLRLFELMLLQHLGLSIDFHQSDGRQFAADCFYTFQAGSGFALSPAEDRSAFPGALLNQAAAGQYQAPGVLLMLKALTRQCLAGLLGSHKIVSRELYRSYIHSLKVNSHGSVLSGKEKTAESPVF